MNLLLSFSCVFFAVQLFLCVSFFVGMFGCCGFFCRCVVAQPRLSFFGSCLLYSVMTLFFSNDHLVPVFLIPLQPWFSFYFCAGFSIGLCFHFFFFFWLLFCPFFVWCAVVSGFILFLYDWLLLPMLSVVLCLYSAAMLLFFTMILCVDCFPVCILLQLVLFSFYFFVLV